MRCAKRKKRKPAPALLLSSKLPRQLGDRLGCRPDRYGRLPCGNAVASILAQMPSVHNKASGGEGSSKKFDQLNDRSPSVTYFLFAAMIFKQKPGLTDEKQR
jgi:hypothetical protein